MARCTHCGHHFNDADAKIKRLEPIGEVKSKDWKLGTYKATVECPRCQTETHSNGVLSLH